MEEAQYRLNQLRDEMDYYLVTTPRSGSRNSSGSSASSRIFGPSEQAVDRVSQTRSGPRRRAWRANCGLAPCDPPDLFGRLHTGRGGSSGWSEHALRNV